MDGGVGEQVGRTLIVFSFDFFAIRPAYWLLAAVLVLLFYFVSSVSLSLFLLRSPPPESLTGVASVEFLSGALTTTGAKRMFAFRLT